ncbi:MAG: ABC transporter ATP-binding protein [Coprococcus sp.]|nr:ABC transporter ATP-binding protein [Coprococcus sp.]
MIKAEGLTKVYGLDFVSVDDLSFHIKKGEIVGFVGQNGAGKTTTIKMLAGILKPTKGKVIINGFDIDSSSLDAKRSVGYISDNPDIFLRLTGAEYVNFIADIYGVSETDRKLRMEDMASRFGMEDSLNKQMVSYSHGMRQKMMVIAALVHNPPVWILDEPMTGLDPNAAYELKKMMREHADAGNCVFFSTHVLEVAEKLCDEIIIIKKGRDIYQGTLDKLVEEHKNKSLEDIFIEMTHTNN